MHCASEYAVLVSSEYAVLVSVVFHAEVARLTATELCVCTPVMPGSSVELFHAKKLTDEGFAC